MSALRLAWMLSALAVPGAAWAGAPYVTDDPEPTDLGHVEIYSFATGGGTPGHVTGEAGLEVDYGAAKNLQVGLVLPAAFDNARLGAGDVELAAKYRLISQHDSGWLPDVAVFPRLFIPTSSRFAQQSTGVFVPVWAQKDFGPWSVFGGGGVLLSFAAGQRNIWRSGLAVTRSFGDRLSLGVEAYHQTARNPASKDFTGVDVGATYQLSSHWSLMASGGPGVEHARQGGRYAFYAALEATY